MGGHPGNRAPGQPARRRWAAGLLPAGLAAEPTITQGDLERILYRNAADVYGFDMHALQPVTDRAGLDLT